jgi:hypothetical protein
VSAPFARHVRASQPLQLGFDKREQLFQSGIIAVGPRLQQFGDRSGRRPGLAAIGRHSMIRRAVGHLTTHRSGLFCAIKEGWSARSSKPMQAQAAIRWSGGAQGSPGGRRLHENAPF